MFERPSREDTGPHKPGTPHCSHLLQTRCPSCNTTDLSWLHVVARDGKSAGSYCPSERVDNTC